MWNPTPGTDFRLKSLWCIFFDAPCSRSLKVKFVFLIPCERFLSRLNIGRNNDAVQTFWILHPAKLLSTICNRLNSWSRLFYDIEFQFYSAFISNGFVFNAHPPLVTEDMPTTSRMRCCTNILPSTSPLLQLCGQWHTPYIHVCFICSHSSIIVGRVLCCVTCLPATSMWFHCQLDTPPPSPNIKTFANPFFSSG